MLTKMLSDIDLKFLEFFDINLKSGKLIDKTTNKEFDLVEKDDRYYTYTCEDKTIEFTVMEYNGGIIATDISYSGNGFQYRINSYLAGDYVDITRKGLHLNIRNLENGKSGRITMYPAINENFVSTSIKHSFFHDYSVIICNFLGIISEACETQPLTLDGYKKAYEESAKRAIYDNSFINEFLRIAPFIYDVYEDYASYPVKYFEKYNAYFLAQQEQNLKTFREKSLKARDDRKTFISNKYKEIKEKYGNITPIQEGMIFLEASTMYTEANDRIIDQMEQKAKFYDDMESGLIEYVKSCNKKNK